MADAKVTILLVEDNRFEAQEISRSLEKRGYSVSSIVASGEEAIQKAEEEKPDLVLMDIMLEGEMDGIEAAETIHNHFNIPIIYLSAFSEEYMLERAKITEPFGYLIKPFVERELYTTIEMALYKHKIDLENMKVRNFLSSILDGIGDGVVVVDRDFRIISSNRGYCGQAKMACEEIIGRHCYEVSHHRTKPCHESGEECSVKSAFETGSSQRKIHTHFDRDDNPQYIETISYPLRDPSGNVELAIEVLTDVTERVFMENELQKKMKELEDFYNMAIGRELRMAELRDEIEILKERLKRYEQQ